MDKLILSLDEVIARLPDANTPLDLYLNALYALGLERHIPNISPNNVAFLQDLLRLRQPQNLLEIGCANGYSTLRFWQVAHVWQASITTMDISKPSFDEAQHHFRTLNTNIEAYFGNALEIFPTLPHTHYDFIFIDAQKTATLDFFVRTRKLASSNALIVIDDVLKFKGKMQHFYDYLVAHNISYEIEQVDADDGVMLIDLAKNPLLL